MVEKTKKMDKYLVKKKFAHSWLQKKSFYKIHLKGEYYEYKTWKVQIATVRVDCKIYMDAGCKYSDDAPDKKIVIMLNILT